MATDTRTRHGGRIAPGDRVVGVGVAVLGVYMTVIGVFAFAAPGAFFDSIGPYGAENHHYIRDIGSFHIAFGVLALAAVGRASWRLPVLVLAVVQFALHSVSHLVDIGGSDPGWLGPFAFVGLALGTVALALLLVRQRAGGR